MLYGRRYVFCAWRKNILSRAIPRTGCGFGCNQVESRTPLSVFGSPLSAIGRLQDLYKLRLESKLRTSFFFLSFIYRFFFFFLFAFLHADFILLLKFLLIGTFIRNGTLYGVYIKSRWNFHTLLKAYRKRFLQSYKNHFPRMSWNTRTFALSLINRSGCSAISLRRYDFTRTIRLSSDFKKVKWQKRAYLIR